MKIYYAILLCFIFGKSFGFKPNHQIERQSKSIFSKKKCKETFTPARYQARMKSIKYDQPAEKIPEHYFPAVDYPTCALEAAKPYFYKACEGSAMLGPFPEDVKTSFKSLRDKNKQNFNDMKAKYMNDYSINVNSQMCNKENASHPIIIEETVTGENSTEVIDETCAEVIDETCVEVIDETCIEINDDIPEDEPAALEDAVDEADLTGTTSESEETDESGDEISEPEDEVQVAEKELIEDFVEEKILNEDQLQSRESGQGISEEIIDKEQVIEQAENSTSITEIIEEIIADDGSEEAVEEVVCVISEPEISSEKEEELCPPPLENKTNATLCDKKNRDHNNMKLLQKIRKKNYLKRQQAQKKPNMNFAKKF